MPFKLSSNCRSQRTAIPYPLFMHRDKANDNNNSKEG